MKSRACKIIVNNIPDDTDQWIVARIGADYKTLWYWGSYSEKSRAENVANTLG